MIPLKQLPERDVRNLVQIGDLNQFERFLKLCTVRTGLRLRDACLLICCITDVLGAAALYALPDRTARSGPVQAGGLC